jgi:glycolate oxidase FAD binding subunit
MGGPRSIGYPGADMTDALQGAVHRSLESGEALDIQGTGSKRFYGRKPTGRPIDVAGHRGVLSYEPSELVLTARAGTPVREVEALLAEHGQMLAFEPPRFGEEATLGGTVACNLSGPRRPYAGAARDFLLGIRLINGHGDVVRFGGEVMKNVAGYDVSRLMAGALGTLGLLLELSLKVLPAPECEQTLELELDQGEAIAAMNRLASRPLPLSGAAWIQGRVVLRLSGSEAGVRAAVEEIGGEAMDGTAAVVFWRDLREHRLSYFEHDGLLWRLSLPPAAAPLPWPGDWLIDWGGAQRWLRTDLPADQVREQAAAADGHATAFRGGDREAQVFHPLGAVMLRLHRRIKKAMDPRGIFNPGRMYAEL